MYSEYTLQNFGLETFVHLQQLYIYFRSINGLLWDIAFSDVRQRQCCDIHRLAAAVVSY